MTSADAAAYVGPALPPYANRMRLSDYLEPALVLLDLRATGIEETLHAVVERLHEAGGVRDPEAVLEALVERERTHSTSLGNGVALPHATVAGVERPVVLVAVSPTGVRFDEGEMDPVRVFFVLLSPVSEAGTHIKLLARIVRLVRRPGFVATVTEAETGDALVQAIERLDALHV